MSQSTTETYGFSKLDIYISKNMWCFFFYQDNIRLNRNGSKKTYVVIFLKIWNWKLTSIICENIGRYESIDSEDRPRAQHKCGASRILQCCYQDHAKIHLFLSAPSKLEGLKYLI